MNNQITKKDLDAIVAMTYLFMSVVQPEDVLHPNNPEATAEQKQMFYATALATMMEAIENQLSVEAALALPEGVYGITLKINFFSNAELAKSDEIPGSTLVH